MTAFWHDGYFDTEAALEHTRAYVDKWQRRLHIPEWEVRVGIESADKHAEDHAAACQAMPEYLTATILLNPNESWADISLQEEEQVILHELCHILTARARNFVFDQLSEDQPDLWNQYSDLDEEQVERIARQTWQAYQDTEGDS